MTQTSCAHCGLVFSPLRSEKFCCAGCEFVFALIQGEGLGQYYQIRESSATVCPVPARTSSESYDFCDDVDFLRVASPDGKRLRFYLEGLNCTACLWLLEKLPQFCADAESARVDMSSSTIEVYRKPSGSFAAIARTLNQHGYRPHPLRETESSLNHQLQEKRKDLIRIGVAGALTGNIMIFAVSLYAGATGIYANEFRWLSAVLAFPVLTYCAWPFYRNTFAAFQTRQLNLDVPIVVALLAGVVTSLWALVIGQATLYFDSLSMLIFLLLSSRFVLKVIQNHQLSVTNLEDELLLSSVMKRDADGHLEKVSSLSLLAGDVIEMRNDTTVPIDGVIIEGSGFVSTAVLTGESEPIAMLKGMNVQAGSRTLNGDWLVRVEKPPRQTRLAQILRDTELSSRAKSSFVRFSDRVSTWFIALVFFAAAILFIAFLSSQPLEGISRALALVIVTCPCVFGIAIPLSMSLAIRNAAQLGIVIKDANAIERLWSAHTVFFDKTGTLTTGEMSVLNFDNLNENSDDDLEIALGLEEKQPHPVARAISKYLKENRFQPRQVENIHLLESGGISGQADGTEYSIRPIPAQFSANLSHPQLIRSTYGLLRENTLIATFQLGDQVRPQALSLLNGLRSRHLTTRLLSGDRKNVVQPCAEILGFHPLDIQSELSPEKKAQFIRSTSNGTVMIGDGANDAAALAAADVGIAVCGSLDVSLRAADVYLTRPHLSSIADLFEISRKTRSAVRRNLLFSATFNLLSGTLAAAGMMTPLWAAVLMPLSSIIVLLSALSTGKRTIQAKVSPV